MNGHKVIDICQATKRAIYLEQITTGALEPILEKEIKSIVTKEMMKSVEYEV